jgi:DnaJ-class molecular chaperone
MTNRLDQLDYYTLLQVEDGATGPAIKRAFRSFARRYHPDRFIDASPEKRSAASEIYRRGSEAVQVLTHAEERTVYDSVLQRGQLRLSPEERDRASAPAEDLPEPKDEDRITSPQAKNLFRQAQYLEGVGNLRDAWKLLDAAGREEPQNEMLEGYITRLAGRLRGGF